MNEQTLELKMKATAQDSIKVVEKLVTLLTNIDKNISNVSQKLNVSNSAIKNTSKNIDTLKSSTDKATNSANKLRNALKGALTFVGAKKFASQMFSWINEGIDYTEQLNLFNVVFDNIEENGKQSFSNLGKEAIQFQYKLNEAFGTNKTQTLYMQGIFQSMGETVGIEDAYSAIMSETMTKLTYDLASLYNKTETATAEAIRAGVYAGQTKPLRSFGIDVTQMSMQPILNELGIDEQVKNMSQAEKEILRYLATLKQAKTAMGDLANTIESPSNQLKVFRQQLTEAKVAMSSLFIGTFSKILPYANAFLMVVKEVSKAIATMFGIELKDYNSGIASQEGIYDGIADSADSASKAVKELRRQTLGFDEIHNINENKDTGSGATGISGGIDQRLLDAIQGYDNGMDKVKMKATEIRDRIMEWLGFTKEIDSLTGEVRFKFTDTDSNLYKIVKALKEIYDNGKKVVSEVFGKLIEDFKYGLFGDIVVTILNGIADALKWISEHKTSTDIITKVVESLLLIKGVNFIGQITGIGEIGTSLFNLKPATESAIGKAGTGKMSTGATGLLGTLGILVALTEVNWIVSLAVEGADAIKEQIDATNKSTDTLTDSTEDYLKKIQELTKAGKGNTKECKQYIDALKRNIQHNYASASSMKESLDSSNLLESTINKLSGRTKELTDNQNELISANETSIAVMEGLYEQGLITEEQYADFILTVTNAKNSFENTNKEIGTAKDILGLFSGATSDAERVMSSLKDTFGMGATSVGNLTSAYSINKNIMKELHEQGLISDVQYTNFVRTVDWLRATYGNLNGQLGASQTQFNSTFGTIATTKTGFEGLNTAVGASVTNVKDLINTNNNLKSKTISINADTSQATKTINDLIKKINNSSATFNVTGSIVGGLKANGGVFSNGSWKDISQYANGGAPSHGSMFVAGEHGAEIVGHINGKTEVLNQSQIASAIYSAVVSAMSQCVGQVSQVDVRVHSDGSVVIDEINQVTKQTGVCPIDMPF